MDDQHSTTADNGTASAVNWRASPKRSYRGLFRGSNDGDFRRWRCTTSACCTRPSRSTNLSHRDQGGCSGDNHSLRPPGHGAHLHTSDEHTDGKSQPERRSYYEAIAKTLRGAEQILIFGSGTGKSSAMEQLVADLTEHHAEVAGKIIGSVKVDAHHTTQNQLLAKAREFYADFNK